MLHKLLVLIVLSLLLIPNMVLGEQGMSVVAPEEILAEEDHSTGQDGMTPQSTATVPVPVQAGNVQYLLTRQGFVWEGVIEQGDKTLYVKLPDRSGGVTISRLDVLCIGRSKEELFEYRRAQINQADVGEIIKLADWGVRHQLTPASIAMLQTVAQTADPSVRNILNKKIDQLQYIEKIKLDSLMHKSTRVSPVQTEESRRAEQLRQIEQWGRTIPLAVQDRFLKKVQPVLFRHCSSEGCHRESSKELDFVLYQSVLRSSKRVNGLKNLRSVLARVDLASPQTSRILNHPPVTDRHGKPCYPFGNTPDSLKDYEMFVGWIGGLSGLLSPEDIRSAGEGVSLPVMPQDPSSGVVNPSGQSLPDADRPTKPVGPGMASPAATDSVSETVAAVPQTPGIIQSSTGLTADGQKFLDEQRQVKEDRKRQLGAPDITAPKDAFDPILFNRRYHPDKFK